MSSSSVSAVPSTGKARSFALLAILSAAFIDLMYVTLLNVVLPSIEHDLGAGPSQLQWMLSGYTLPLALGMIPGARLGDRLGHKRVFVAGLLGFVLSSVLCALSPSPEWLIAARVLQGVSAAAMIPQVLTQIQIMYAPSERGGAMAAYSSLAGLAATVGPILGPVLMAWNFADQGWRLVFWVNVPVGLLCAVLALVLLPDSRVPGAPRLGIAGVLPLSIGLLLILYPVTSAAEGGGWPAWAWPALALGAAILAGFVYQQHRMSVRGRAPLLEVSLFRFRSVTGGLTVQMLFFVPVMGFFMVFMLFLQNGLLVSPIMAGLTILPWSVMVAGCAGFSAAVLLPRLGRVTIQLGLVLLAVGFVLLALSSSAASLDTSWLSLLPGVLVGGAGMGVVVAPLAQLTLSDVPVTDAGSGSALFNTITQLAATAGIAVVGMFFFTRINSAPTPTDPATALGRALADSLWLGVAMLAVALAATWLLPRHATRPEARASHSPRSDTVDVAPIASAHTSAEG